MSAGESLRKLRESLGFTIRDVEAASTRIAEKHDNSDYSISLSRLSDIETKDVVPSIYRFLRARFDNTSGDAGASGSGI